MDVYYVLGIYGTYPPPTVMKRTALIVVLVLLAMLVLVGVGLRPRATTEDITVELTGTPGLSVTGKVIVDGVVSHFNGTVPTKLVFRARYDETPRPLRVCLVLASVSSGHGGAGSVEPSENKPDGDELRCERFELGFAVSRSRCPAKLLECTLERRFSHKSWPWSIRSSSVVASLATAVTTRS